MSTNTSTHKSHRVFFALWPNSHTRQQISEAFQQSAYINANARHYLESNLHLTLHFLGNISAEQLNCVQQQAACVKFRPFTLSLNCFGRFKRAGILWLGPDHINDELLQLHQQLGDALRLCDYSAESREYRPHISLMRKFHGELEQISLKTIHWTVDCFALIESVSVSGVMQYRPLRIFNDNTLAEK